jgi:hypothetical protein
VKPLKPAAVQRPYCRSNDPPRRPHSRQHRRHEDPGASPPEYTDASAGPGQNPASPHADRRTAAAPRRQAAESTSADVGKQEPLGEDRAAPVEANASL